MNLTSLNLAKYHMLLVEVGLGSEQEVELGAIGARARIGHGQQAPFIMMQLEVFILRRLKSDPF
jgi:hypothetical protein